MMPYCVHFASKECTSQCVNQASGVHLIWPAHLFSHLLLSQTLMKKHAIALGKVTE